MRKKEISSLDKILSKMRKSTENISVNEKPINIKSEEIQKNVKNKESLKLKKKSPIKKKQNKKQKTSSNRVVWDEYRENRVTYMGQEYSIFLSKNDSNISRLNEYKLPLILSETDLCSLLNIEIPQLKWFVYHKNISTVNHYYRFEVPKKNGSNRLIWAPKQYLKKAQEIIKCEILDLIPLHDSSYGFVKNRSIVDNAVLHLDSEIVINLDIEDFFFSINFFRIVGMFRSIGYSGKVSSLLAMLCSEAPRKEVIVKNQKYYVATGLRTLPQGAPTSPGISNIICRRLDKRMLGLVNHYQLRYTRYADDLSISGNEEISLSEIMYKIISIIKSEDFRIQRSKLRILRKNTRQSVTGITINEVLNPSRKWRHLLRAEIHRLKYIDNEEERFRHTEKVHGKLMFFKMVNPNRAAKYIKMYDIALKDINGKFSDKNE